MAGEIVVKLRHPVQFGKDAAPVEELKLKPTARAFRDLSLRVNAETNEIEFKPYLLAQVGVKMAGQPAAFVDHMDPADMMEVATEVMGFLGTSPMTGSAP